MTSLLALPPSDDLVQDPTIRNSKPGKAMVGRTSGGNYTPKDDAKSGWNKSKWIWYGPIARQRKHQCMHGCIECIAKSYHAFALWNFIPQSTRFCETCGIATLISNEALHLYDPWPFCACGIQCFFDKRYLMKILSKQTIIGFFQHFGTLFFQHFSNKLRFQYGYGLSPVPNYGHIWPYTAIFTQII